MGKYRNGSSCLDSRPIREYTIGPSGENYSIPELDGGIPQNPSNNNSTTFLRNPPYKETSTQVFSFSDTNYLRWVKVGNEIIGPWQASTVHGGLAGWKLIDYGYDYDNNGKKSQSTYIANNTANKPPMFFDPDRSVLNAGITVGGGDILDPNYFRAGSGNFENQYINQLQFRS